MYSLLALDFETNSMIGFNSDSQACNSIILGYTLTGYFVKYTCSIAW